MKNLIIIVNENESYVSFVMMSCHCGFSQTAAEALTNNWTFYVIEWVLLTFYNIELIHFVGHSLDS